MRRSSLPFRKFILGTTSFELEPSDVYYALSILICRVRVPNISRRVLDKFRRFIADTEKYRT